MLLVGVTGAIGTGKSTVSRVFTENGVPVIDADVIAKEVTLPHTKAWSRIKQVFGDDVIQSDGSLNRPRLAAVIFNDNAKRKVLNSIVHPEIYKEMIKQWFVLSLKCEKIVVLDLPLLYESGSAVSFVSKVIVVYCPPDLQKQRILARNNYTVEEAEARMKSQMSLDEKCKRADFVIDNSRSLDETRTQVEKILSQLIREKGYWKNRMLFWTILLLLSSSIGYSCYLFTKKTMSFF